MPADIRSLLHTIDAAEPPVVDLPDLWQRAGRRRQRRRVSVVVGAVALVGTLVGFVVSVNPLSGKGHRINVAAYQAQLNGSPGMPPTFVATDFDNGVYMVDSHSGSVIATLLPPSDHPIDSVATGKSWVYLAVYGSAPTVERVPTVGGPPETLYSANAFDLALSPDGRQLAWANGADYQNRPPNSPGVVSVYNLETHTVTDRVLNQVPHETFSGYGIDGIVWTSDTSLSVLSTSYVAETNAMPEEGCSGSSAGERCTPIPNPVHDAYLTTIDTTSQPSAASRSIGFDLPPAVHPPDDGNPAAHVFANGDTAGSFVVAARDTRSDPVGTYRLTLDGDTVKVRRIQRFGPSEVPTAIDTNNRDTLIISFSPGGRTSEIARSTDGGPPVVLNTTKPWASATW